MRIGAPAVLAFGSNLGDRAATIRAAMDELDAVSGIRVERRSSIVESEAITLAGADSTKPRYLNAVALIDTTLEPHALLAAVNRIENEHGRVRDARWGDRTLDIDLIDYDGRQLDEDDLTLPHPRAAERAFVLAPWVEIAADARLGGRPISDLLAECADAVTAYPADQGGGNR
jgi:2-amino-4-hydroxy-6-hydroxymethyldihydropteridine diphosphokinase